MKKYQYENNKIIAILKAVIVISFAIIAFIFIYDIMSKVKQETEIKKYIVTTSKEYKPETITKEQVKQNSGNKLEYVAILEIPKINLKEGLVVSTKNFNSINYSVSIDKNGNMPDENGNFILYAHSGNSGVGFFRNLDQLNLNDEIFVYYNGTKYIYNVINKYEILKTGTAKVINSKNDKYITLITCNKRRKGYQIVIEGKINSIEVY